MGEILGLLGICAVIIFMVLLGIKYPYLKNIILIGGILRILAGCFHFFIFKLPDGNADSVNFENYAWSFSKLSFEDLFVVIKYKNLALSFVWVLSFIYRLVGRSPLLLQSVSIFIGVLCILLVYKLSFLLSNNEKKAKQSAWILAVFPTVILYNSLILREVFVMFFLLLAFIYFAKWYISKNVNYGILTLVCFIPLYYLHSALILGGITFFILFFIESIDFFKIRYRQNKFSIIHAILLSVTPLVTLYLFTVLPGIKIPYLGKFDDIFTFSRILFQTKVTNFGGSVYPDWLSPESPLDFFLLIIPRLGYLLFSPFIWDLRAINHLLGFVDGLLYLFVFYWIAKGILFEKHKQIITRILIILIPLLIVYSWGVGNFGTALRHRVKFIPVFIAISTIYVPKITLTKKSEGPKPNE
jgi:hypothetical protein